MTETLLPPNATAIETALDRSTARLGDVPADPLLTMWRPADCAVAVLPFLAWAASVDVWGTDWPEAMRREVVARSFAIHRRKGTVWAVREALRVCGFSGATVMEGLHNRRYDGTVRFDGKVFYGDPSAWAAYRVILDRPIANRQVATVLALVRSTAPARSELISLDYRAVANVYDGRSLYDGAFNFGVAA